MPRLFVGLPLPEAPRAELALLIEELRTAALPAGTKLTRVPNLHLTLRFLGSVGVEEIPTLSALLGQVHAPGFYLRLQTTGVFPKGPPSRARVLWAGVDAGERIATLKQRIDEVLGPDPEKEERGFTPHVTLARFARAPGSSLDDFLAAHADITSAPFAIGEFVLYESRSDGDGVRYEPRARYPLHR